MAVDHEDTYVVCTRSAVYAIAAGEMPELVAGQHSTAATGYVDGQGFEARFKWPRGIAIDIHGNIIVADTNNHAVRKVTRNGVVCTLAGSGVAGFADGLGSAACFNQPMGIVVDSHGCIFVCDCENHRIRRLWLPDDEDSVAGVTSTIAGNDVLGHQDGIGALARFCFPTACAMDLAGNLIVSERGNNCIRKVSALCVVTTLAGKAGSPGFADGVGVDALFDFPAGVVVDGGNNVLVADRRNHRIRMIAPAGGPVTTLSGAAEAGGNDGLGTARFSQPCSLALDGCGRLLVAEFRGTGRMRMIRTDLLWEKARVLYIGLLKGCMQDQLLAATSINKSGVGCLFALLPVQDGKGLTSPILTRIIEMVCDKTPSSSSAHFLSCTNPLSRKVVMMIIEASSCFYYFFFLFLSRCVRPISRALSLSVILTRTRARVLSLSPTHLRFPSVYVPLCLSICTPHQQLSVKFCAHFVCTRDEKRQFDIHACLRIASPT